MGIQKHTADNPCGICGGHEKLPQGQGIRCWGFVGDDGWAVCTQIESPFPKDNAGGWSHALEGRCKCGVTHGERSEPYNPDWRGDAPKSPPVETKRAEVREIGEAARATIDCTYDYVNFKGELLYQVVRMKPKTFLQRRRDPRNANKWLWWLQTLDKSERKALGIPDQPTVLYRIPDVAAALPAGDDIWIVEGEKDADALHKRMLVATCNAGGAGKWRDELAQPFAKASGRIVIVQDKDPEFDDKGRPHHRGQKHARQVFDSIRAVAPEHVSVTIVEAREGKDASDHFAAGFGATEFVHVWPMSGEMLNSRPGEYKRHILRQALIMDESALYAAAGHEDIEHPPQFRSPLMGDRLVRKWQGVVTIAGAPSSGKSYAAISCGIDNAMSTSDPWEVFYLNCEMGKGYVIDRGLRAVASADLDDIGASSEHERRRALEHLDKVKIPPRFQRVDVELGVTMNQVIEYLAENVTDTNTLVVIDSISSFVDNMEEVEGDSFGMSNLRVVSKYATAVRRLTQGRIAWILLSELNKEGRAKGRSLDHRSDMAISMAPNPDKGHLKEIKVTKSWFGPTGDLGTFVLHPEIGRLVKADF